MVDAPASGAGARKGVEVRVLSWAPSLARRHIRGITEHEHPAQSSPRTCANGPLSLTGGHETSVQRPRASSTSSRPSTTNRSPISARRSPLTSRTARRPTREARKQGAFAYPELRIDYAGKVPRSASDPRLRPAQPARHLCDAASPGPSCSATISSSSSSISAAIMTSPISVGRSASEIPYAYVIENSGIQVGDIGTAELSRFFPSNELVHLGDEIADGVWVSQPDAAAAAGPVRRAAHRLQPGAAAALHRHAARAFPAVRAVHQLCPLRRRVRRRRDRHAAAQGFALHRAVGARARSTSRAS